MRIWVDVITWVQRRKHFNQDTFPSTFVLVRVIWVLIKSSNRNQVRKDRRVNKLKIKPERCSYWVLQAVFTLGVQQVGRYSPIQNQSPGGFIGVCVGSHWATHLQSWKDSLPDKKKKRWKSKVITASPGTLGALDWRSVTARSYCHVLLLGWGERGAVAVLDPYFSFFLFQNFSSERLSNLLT